MLIGLLLGIKAGAQFAKAELQVNGLTCSMCSFATQKQLQTIEFIDSIGIDLNYATFILYFKTDVAVNSDLIRSKVEDEGFAVGSLTFINSFIGLSVENNVQLELKKNLYQFMEVSSQTLNGELRIRIIDKGFLPEREFRKYNKLSTKYPYYKTGKTPEGIRIYHIIII